MRECPLTASVAEDIARMEGEGPVPEPRKGAFGLTTEGDDTAGLKAVALPLAPPERPMILGDTSCRIALIRDDDPEHPVALDVDFTGEDALVAASKLVKGRMELTFTSGFGRVRTIQLSPAEFMLVLAYGDRFFQELPK